jgi:hypothetical protein
MESMKRLSGLVVLIVMAPGLCCAKDPSTTQEPAVESKRLFGIIPNYRTTPNLTEYVPLSTHAKFSVASEDAFDRGTIVLATIFAGQGQLSNSNRSLVKAERVTRSTSEQLTVTSSSETT